LAGYNEATCPKPHEYLYIFLSKYSFHHTFTTMKTILFFSVLLWGAVLQAQVDTITAIHQDQESQANTPSTVICSPNPVYDQLTVCFDNDTEYNLPWEIADMSGRIRIKGIYPAFEQKMAINTETLQENGTYFLQLATPHGTETIRFIIAD
jgi:Secretion system C-terminal sorting domain